MKFRSKLSKLSDEELMVVLAKKNDHEALTILYERYAKRLLAYFIKMFKGDEQKGQDFLQDLFIKVLENSGKFDANKKFYTWVFTIASNMAKTSFREKPTIELNTNLHGRSADSRSLDQISKGELRQEIFQLEPKQRDVLLLRYNQGFTVDEIAGILEINPGTVKSRIFYATKKLAEALKQDDIYSKSKNYG
ncbi:MAG: RNA polymerase sigma factor [Crocinitomicaceae bacterium]|nr:RNA polymerase sigma factor [Crocinitomicaceae bacterium]